MEIESKVAQISKDIIAINSPVTPTFFVPSDILIYYWLVHQVVTSLCARWLHAVQHALTIPQFYAIGGVRLAPVNVVGKRRCRLPNFLSSVSSKAPNHSCHERIGIQMFYSTECPGISRNILPQIHLALYRCSLFLVMFTNGA